MKITEAVKNSTPRFRIYKEGHTTAGPVTIVSVPWIPFDEDAKRKFYKALGYEVTPIGGTKELETMSAEELGRTYVATIGYNPIEEGESVEATRRMLQEYEREGHEIRKGLRG